MKLKLFAAWLVVAMSLLAGVQASSAADPENTMIITLKNGKRELVDTHPSDKCS